jgi:inorganic pyrophosphatase
MLDQISHFFEHYKDLESEKWVKVKGWGEAEEAMELIRVAIGRAKKS